ncbi:hypothetical protein BGZ72_003948, partial [Mortierella alpina]
PSNLLRMPSRSPTRRSSMSNGRSARPPPASAGPTRSRPTRPTRRLRRSKRSSRRPRPSSLLPARRRSRSRTPRSLRRPPPL